MKDPELYRGKPQKIIDTMDELNKDRANMNVGPEKARKIVELIQEADATFVIELGCYVGYSALVIGQELAKIKESSFDKSKFLGLKSFDISEEYAGLARQLIDLAGLSEIVEIIVGPLGHTLPDFEQRLAITYGYFPANFVFIDHQKSMYVPDLRMLESLALVAPGTIIVADNIFFPGAPEYPKYVHGSPQERKDHNANVRNVSNPNYPGRWNVVYDSRTVPVHEAGRTKQDALEVTRCVEYLSG